MIQVIAEHPEVVLCQDKFGKFLFTRESDEIISIPEVPIINTHLGVNGLSSLHAESRAMLS